MNGATRYFYSSTACVYNEECSHKEEDAWPARPQDGYGLEKLYAEQMAITYQRDFGIASRIARYHNVYGPRGPWKAIAAEVLGEGEAIASTTEFDMWGDGSQTCSFMFVDDCVEGRGRSNGCICLFMLFCFCLFYFVWLSSCIF